MNDTRCKLSIIIPVYNSEATIGALVDRLIEHLTAHDLEIILVNDFSQDDSDNICKGKFDQYPGIVRYLRLAKNFGEHNAVMAGLGHARGDYAVIMDDDFQNPPEEVSGLVEVIREKAFDVLYTQYEKKQHSLFRNVGSWFNDRVSNLLLSKPRDLYLSSFKCLNRFLIDQIVRYRGPYPYIDGLILRTTRNIGQTLVRHEQRHVGRSNYTLRKLASLWLNMFVNFSNIPLRVIFLIGTLLTCFGGLLILYFILDMYVLNPQGEWPAGWASLLVCVITFSGTQLISLGVIGEYLGKLYLSSNLTPQYVIRDSRGLEPARPDQESS